MTGNLFVKLIELFICQPWAAIFGEIEREDRLFENIRDDDFTESGSEAFGWIGWEQLPLIDDLPPEGGKLHQEWLFNFGVLRFFVLSVGPSTFTRTLPVRRSCMRPSLILKLSLDREFLSVAIEDSSCNQ